MLHTIHSSIDDRYPAGDPFTSPIGRSVTVYAVGSRDEVTRPDLEERLLDRARDLLRSAAQSTGSALLEEGALGVGESFGVSVAGESNDHTVRIVDGPRAHECIFAVRVTGTHSWT